MNPATHFLTGWAFSLPVSLERKDRALVVLASVAPDLDGLVLIGDFAQGRSLDSLELWSRYHHVLGHNIASAVAITAVCTLLGRRKLLVAGLSFLAVHLHFLEDIIGARGPDGDQWPIPYLLPFSSTWQLTVPWQWELNAWPNIAITIGLLAITVYWAWSRGLSPVGIVSLRADRAFVSALRNRFGAPKNSEGAK